jgi:hypothetical protein
MPYPGSRFVLPDRSSLRTHLAEQVNPYAEPWLNIGDAIGFIMSRRDIGPESAQTKLREACLSGKVRSRHLVIFIDKNDEKRIGFHWLPEEAWSWWNTVDVASGALHTLDLISRLGSRGLAEARWLARLPAMRISTEHFLTRWNASCRRGQKAQPKLRGTSHAKAGLKVGVHPIAEQDGLQISIEKSAPIVLAETFYH